MFGACHAEADFAESVTAAGSKAEYAPGDVLVISADTPNFCQRLTLTLTLSLRGRGNLYSLSPLGRGPGEGETPLFAVCFSLP